jgi:ABC-type glycerol-3-phosphate transport system substrate-binding protein
MHPRGKAKQYVAAGGGAGWAIARQSKATEAAWAFLQHITSTDANVLSCQLAGGGTGGGRRSANAHPACMPSEPPLNVRVFVDGADYVHIDPRVPGWDEVNGIFETELRVLWEGRTAARQVAAEIKRQVDPVLKERARALGI